MDWLRKVFGAEHSPEKAEAQKQAKAKRKSAQEHQRKVRAREDELRRGKQWDGARHPKMFWGSPGLSRGSDEINEDMNKAVANSKKPW